MKFNKKFSVVNSIFIVSLLGKKVYKQRQTKTLT